MSDTLRTLLIASSPVEIEAKAEMADLPQAAHDAAARLFHELTSRLELSSFRISAEGGEEWPKHRFLFGTTEQMAGIVERLRAEHGAVDVAQPGTAPHAHPDVLFAAGSEGDFSAVLLGCRDAGRMLAVTGALVPGGDAE